MQVALEECMVPFESQDARSLHAWKSFVEPGVGARVLVRGHGSCRNCNGSAESGAEELRGLDTGEDREGAKDEVTPHGS